MCNLYKIKVIFNHTRHSIGCNMWLSDLIEQRSTCANLQVYNQECIEIKIDIWKRWMTFHLFESSALLPARSVDLVNRRWMTTMIFLFRSRSDSGPTVGRTWNRLPQELSWNRFRRFRTSVQVCRAAIPAAGQTNLFSCWAGFLFKPRLSACLSADFAPGFQPSPPSPVKLKSLNVEQEKAKPTQTCWSSPDELCLTAGTVHCQKVFSLQKSTSEHIFVVVSIKCSDLFFKLIK